MIRTKNKIYFIALLIIITILAMGCNNIAQEDIIFRGEGYVIYKKLINNHSIFLLHSGGKNYPAAMMHNPDCWCQLNIYNEKINKNKTIEQNRMFKL